MTKKTIKKKTSKKATSEKKEAASRESEPKFPYTNKPNSLRKFLKQIPTKPNPGQVKSPTLKSWGLKDGNDYSIVRVLKALGLLAANNDTTDRYKDFMHLKGGPAVLAAAVKEVWAPLFRHSHAPYDDPPEELKNQFNIHSGGSERTIEHQIATFKVVCEFADFATNAPTNDTKGKPKGEKGKGSDEPPQPSIHINLHIHLPENKTQRDYAYMFEDIARYIYGRDVGEQAGDNN